MESKVYTMVKLFNLSVVNVQEKTVLCMYSDVLSTCNLTVTCKKLTVFLSGYSHYYFALDKVHAN